MNRVPNQIERVQIQMKNNLEEYRSAKACLGHTKRTQRVIDCQTQLKINQSEPKYGNTSPTNYWNDSVEKPKKKTH